MEREMGLSLLYQIGGKRLYSIYQLGLNQTFEHRTTKYDRDHLQHPVKAYILPLRLALSLILAKISSEDLST